MKKLLSTIAVIMVIAAPLAYADKHGEKEAVAPATSGVQFHAGWCGGCKIIEPKLKEVMD